MRIKINVTAYEAEVLDRNGERVYYAKGENYRAELNATAALDELKALGLDIMAFGKDMEAAAR